MERLRSRVAQVFDRLETQIKQILREAELREGLRTEMTATQAANLLLSVAEGRINQFVRSEFKRIPTQDWDAQWRVLTQAIFK